MSVLQRLSVSSSPVGLPLLSLGRALGCGSVCLCQALDSKAPGFPLVRFSAQTSHPHSSVRQMGMGHACFSLAQMDIPVLDPPVGSFSRHAEGDMFF